MSACGLILPAKFPHNRKPIFECPRSTQATTILSSKIRGFRSRGCVKNSSNRKAQQAATCWHLLAHVMPAVNPIDCYRVLRIILIYSHGFLWILNSFLWISEKSAISYRIPVDSFVLCEDSYKVPMDSY